MKTLRFIGMVIMAMALCMGVTSCGSDDDNKSDSLKGYNLVLEQYKDYKDGEIVNSSHDVSIFLQSNGTAKFNNYNDSKLYSGGGWTISGKTLTIVYYNKSGEIAKKENYSVENVYSFGYFILRLDVNSDDVDYRRVCGIIDSDVYDDAETPDWFDEEW